MLIALAIITLVLGIVIVILVCMDRKDCKSHTAEITDMYVRMHNANAVANKLSSINQSWHQMMMRNGNVRCNRCGKFVRYADAYIDTGSDCCLCQACAAKSLSKKDVCHV